MSPVVRLLIASGIVSVAIIAIVMIWLVPSGERQVGTTILPSVGQGIGVSPELRYDDRWQALIIPRNADGVVCVSIVDRTTGEVKSFQCFPSCRQ